MSTHGCTVIPPGEGPRYWLAGDEITFKLRSEDTGGRFVMLETSVVPQAGPPPHIHHNEHETFYVLDGQFEFLFEDVAGKRGAGTTLFLPKDRVHAFKNVHTEVARTLVFCTPCGFDRFVPAAGEVWSEKRWGTAPTMDDINKLMRVAPQFGLEVLPGHKPSRPMPESSCERSVWVMGMHICIKLDAEHSNGEMSVVEITMPENVGPPPHVHHAMDEVFYVLEGEVEFILGDTRQVCGPGTTVFVPRGRPHAFRGHRGSAKVFDLHTPAGFERFFEEIGTPAKDKLNPPPPQMPDMAEVVKIFEKHGMSLA